MLQRHTYRLKTTYRPYNLNGTIMPFAGNKEWSDFACLKKAGSSGYLGPGVSILMD